MKWLERRVVVDRQLVGVGEGDTPVFGPQVKDRLANRPRTDPPSRPTVVDELGESSDQLWRGARWTVVHRPGGRIGAVQADDLLPDAWRKAAGPLGVATGEGYHLLRHHYASVLIANGESVKTDPRPSRAHLGGP